jgi:hypothetical protein
MRTRLARPKGIKEQQGISRRTNAQLMRDSKTPVHGRPIIVNRPTDHHQLCGTLFDSMSSLDGLSMSKPRA